MLELHNILINYRPGEASVKGIATRWNQMLLLRSGREYRQVHCLSSYFIIAITYSTYHTVATIRTSRKRDASIPIDMNHMRRKGIIECHDVYV
jgi:hypothetical protein